MSLKNLRIGTGFDAHAFGPDRDLILGGVKIPFDRGLLGHSDADALTHAIVDALLGAAGMADIGTHFPSSDEKWKGASSLQFLEWTRDRFAEDKIEILSIDAVVVTQKPKLAEHFPAIRERLCQSLRLEPGRLHVKATTTDYLGFVGREEGLAVQASCLVLLSK